MISRSLILCTAIATCVLGGACVTIQISEDIDKRYSSFPETITSFLMTQDQKTLIVIGAKNHFFLNLTPQMKAILQHPARPKMKADFDGLRIYWNQTVIGKYNVEIDHTQWQLLPTAQQINLQQLGFQYSKNHQAYVLTGQLSGKRYGAGGFKLPPRLGAFNKPYEISVFYEYPPKGQIAEQIIATPIGIIGDSIFIAGALAAAPIALPIAGLYMLFD